MILVNRKTGDPISFDANNLPSEAEMKHIESLLLDDMLNIDDIYSLIDLFSSQHKITGNFYIKEKEFLLKLIDSVSEFSGDPFTDSKLYLLALYIQYVINLYAVPIPSTLKKLLSFSIDFKNKIDEFQVIDESEINKFIGFLRSYCDNPGILFNRNDLEIYKIKIRTVLSELRHPLTDSLRGIFYLFDNDLEKAASAFEVDENVLKKNVNSFCNEEFVDYNGNTRRHRHEDIMKLLNNKVRNVGLELLNSFKNRNDHKFSNEIVSLFEKFNNSRCDEKKEVYLNELISLKHNNDRLSMLSIFPSLLTECNIPNVFDTISDTFYYILKSKIEINDKLLKELNETGFLFIEKMEEVFKETKNEIFNAKMNYIIGKVYHILKIHHKAVQFYKKSDTHGSKLNLMSILSKSECVLDLNKTEKCYDTIYVRNIYCLENKIFDKIVTNNKINGNIIFKTVKEENWSGYSIINYLNLLKNNDVDQKTVINNLAFFYYKAINENETEMIEKMYNVIKNEHSHIFENGIEEIKINCRDFSVGLEERYKNIVVDVTVFVVYLLYKFSYDDVSLYNLSFFVKKEKSLELIEKIKEKSKKINFRKYLLKESTEEAGKLKNSDLLGYLLLSGHFYQKNKNINKSKEFFKNLLSESLNKNNIKSKEDIKTAHSYYLFGSISLGKIYLSEYKKNKRREDLVTAMNYFKDGLKYNSTCLYCVLYISIVYYEMGEYFLSSRISKELLNDVRTKKEFESLKDILSRIVGVCYIKLGNVEAALKYFSESNDKKFVDDLKSVISNKDTGRLDGVKRKIDTHHESVKR